MFLRYSVLRIGTISFVVSDINIYIKTFHFSNSLKKADNFYERFIIKKTEGKTSV